MSFLLIEEHPSISRWVSPSPQSVIAPSVYTGTHASVLIFCVRHVATTSSSVRAWHGPTCLLACDVTCRYVALLTLGPRLPRLPLSRFPDTLAGITCLPSNSQFDSASHDNCSADLTNSRIASSCTRRHPVRSSDASRGQWMATSITLLPVKCSQLASDKVWSSGQLCARELVEPGCRGRCQKGGEGQPSRKSAVTSPLPLPPI